MTKISRVLIIGCTGLIGHGVALYLIKNNFQVFGTANSKKAKSINSNFKLYKNINLLDEKSFIKINKIIKSNDIQAIIHSAALIPNKSHYNKKNFYNNSIKINALSFLKLYEISKINNIKFLVNISTPNIANTKKINLENHHNFYIFTKNLAEYFLSNLSKSKTKVVSLRIKSPYGYILNTRAVVPNFINKIIDNKKLNLKGDVNKKRTFTFVEDIGSACEEIFKKNMIGIQNCIGTESISIKDLVKVIHNIFSKKKNVKIHKNINYTKYHYKNNINQLKTTLNNGLLKISNVKKNYGIFKLK